MPPRKKAVKKEAQAPSIIADVISVIEETAVVASQEEIEPVVMQLPIPTKRVESLLQDEMQNIPETTLEPLPYIPNNNFSSENDTLLKDENKNKHTHHEIVCFWCCHTIIDTEYGMPIRYDVFHNNFTMFGSFCSLECAAAYNYSTNMGSDRAWEIHSWIQALAQKYGIQGPIRPAPNKYLLRIFNGPLTIDEFRSSHKGMSKQYVMNIPPFIHINSQMECLNTSFLEKNVKQSKK